MAAQTPGPLADQIQYRSVWNQLATAHVTQRRLNGRCPFAFRKTFGHSENIARGEVTGVESLTQQLGLSPFAYAGRAEQHEAKALLCEFRGHGTAGVFAFEPGGTVIFCIHGVLQKVRARVVQYGRSRCSVSVRVQ